VRAGETVKFADPADVGCLLHLVRMSYWMPVGAAEGDLVRESEQGEMVDIELVLGLNCPQLLIYASFAFSQHVPQDNEVDADQAALG
jgi:hypothetical protein